MPTRIKRDEVRTMFSDIAPTYDLLNRILSFGVDRFWRRRAVASLLHGFEEMEDCRFLDLATGTADVALEICRRAEPDACVLGVDFALPMLARGRRKALDRDAALSLIQADGLRLPFLNGAFDGVIVAFGLRNFEHRETGLREMGRVMRPGGRLVVLEFGHPKGLFGFLYAFYSGIFLPFVGRLISAHPTAYGYLPRTAREFPRAARLSEMMREAGFCEVSHLPMTGGVAALHVGVRK